MNGLYHLERNDPDYDQLNNMVVAAGSKKDALKMWEYQPAVNIKVKHIGQTRSSVGTIILKDY